MNRAQLQADMEKRVGQAQKLLGDPARNEEFRTEIDAINKIGEQIRAIDKAEEELRAVKEAERRAPAPVEQPEHKGWEHVRKQFIDGFRGGKAFRVDLSGIEHRAITSNGAGTNTVPGIIKALVDGGKLRPKLSVFQGPNAVTTVPVFSPHMAVPVGTVPGATGTSSDSTAVLAGDALTLKPWYSTLAISMGALISTDIGSYMPGIFSEAFGAAIDKGVLVGAGSGSDMLGVFIASASGVNTDSDITATGSGAAPVWADYMKVALALLALNGSPDGLAIAVHPTVFATALGVTTNDPEKIEFLTRQTILSIPVILSGHALTTLTTGSYVAVGGQFRHFALAIAQEILIDQIKTVGSDNVTFQSFMYMQGKPLIGLSFRRLKTG